MPINGLLKASKPIFEVEPGYICEVVQVDDDPVPVPLNTLSVKDMTANIFFRGCDEFDLGLNHNAANL